MKTLFCWLLIKTAHDFNLLVTKLRTFVRTYSYVQWNFFISEKKTQRTQIRFQLDWYGTLMCDIYVFIGSFKWLYFLFQTTELTISMDYINIYQMKFGEKSNRRDKSHETCSIWIKSKDHKVHIPFDVHSPRIMLIRIMWALSEII